MLKVSMNRKYDYLLLVPEKTAGSLAQVAVSFPKNEILIIGGIMALPKKEIGKCLSCSVQFSRSVVSNSL